MVKILFLNDAIEDIRKARNWYDEKEEGLGHFFIIVLMKVLMKFKTHQKHIL